MARSKYLLATLLLSDKNILQQSGVRSSNLWFVCPVPHFSAIEQFGSYLHFIYHIYYHYDDLTCGLKFTSEQEPN